MKTIRQILVGNIMATGDLGLVVTRGHTGRSSSVGSDYRLAEAWAKCVTRDQLLSHEAADRFRAALESCAGPQEQRLVLLRGRPDDGTLAGWQSMGPPTHAPVGGRYNPAGEVVLYLCDSSEGVRRELPRDANVKLFLQRYDVPVAALNLLDASAPHIGELIGGVFDIAESAAVAGRVGPSDFQFGQVVAAVVREAGFGGMLVPGVRGDRTLRYRNAIICDPGDRWIAWSQEDRGFSISEGAG